MGFNDNMFAPPIVLDIETAAHPCAAEFIEPLNLDGIVAAKNLKDPEKVTADLERRRQDATAEHATKMGRAALDWNLSRIVALAWSGDAGDTVIVKPCATEDEERSALAAFWKEAEGRLLLGFCARNFDVPTLIQRSRLLNVPHRDVNLARFGKGSVIDLRDVLTFDDARYEALMTRSLKSFCRRFGLEVTDEIDGRDIAQLVAAGDWDGVISHVTSDVRLTAQLAQRIGILAKHETVAF
jgi:RNase H-like protein